MIYYIGDIHFNDKRVFDLCRRPFKNIDEYNEEIIKNWNAKVSNTDIVYVLGDLAEESYDEVINIVSLLNGIKHLIIGNHDMLLLERIRESKVFESIEFMKFIDDQGRKVHLCHYPILDWQDYDKGGYHIYGHIHNKTAAQGLRFDEIRNYLKGKLAFNAGVDVIGFEPVTLDEMIKLKERNRNEPYIN